MKPEVALRLIKLVHTVIWAFFAGCILAVPVFSYAGNMTIAAILCAVVMVEVSIILLNKWRCPLTPIAAKYTSNRKDNFDIYLPVWLARYNKVIFGILFVAGALYTLFKWLGMRGDI